MPRNYAFQHESSGSHAEEGSSHLRFEVQLDSSKAGENASNVGGNGNKLVVAGESASNVGENGNKLVVAGENASNVGGNRSKLVVAGESASNVAENRTKLVVSKLERHLGLCGALSFIVGSMIGSGIFVSGGAVAQRSGSVGLFLCVWTGCGILASLGALCYAELGTAIPRSGSEYAYLKYAFGDVGAFMFAWVSALVLKPATLAIICLALGNVLVEPLQTIAGCVFQKQFSAKAFASVAIGEILDSSIFLAEFPVSQFGCKGLCHAWIISKMSYCLTKSTSLEHAKQKPCGDWKPTRPDYSGGN